MCTDNVSFEDFRDSIRELFGADVRSQDIKLIYQKISTNPDAKYDWSEVYFRPISTSLCQPGFPGCLVYPRIWKDLPANT